MSGRPLAPGLDCLRPGHLWVRMLAPDGIVGSWCIWCGTGAYDGDRLDDVTDIAAHGDWKSRQAVGS